MSLCSSRRGTRPPSNPRLGKRESSGGRKGCECEDEAGRGKRAKGSIRWTGGSGPGASSLLLLLRNPTSPALRQSRTEVVDRPTERAGPDVTAVTAVHGGHGGHSRHSLFAFSFAVQVQATHTHTQGRQAPRNASVRAQGSNEKKVVVVVVVEAHTIKAGKRRAHFSVVKAEATTKISRRGRLLSRQHENYHAS